mmetsp:Transcript_47904/g.147807  ORF Transcript_47904/g.147807 Transcript_47904/m.147807 type:complete len:268 (-) Transcript_47904:1169-1972(-)
MHIRLVALSEHFALGPHFLRVPARISLVLRIPSLSHLRSWNRLFLSYRFFLRFPFPSASDGALFSEGALVRAPEFFTCSRRNAGPRLQSKSSRDPNAAVRIALRRARTTDATWARCAAHVFIRTCDREASAAIVRSSGTPSSSVSSLTEPPRSDMSLSPASSVASAAPRPPASSPRRATARSAWLSSSALRSSSSFLLSSTGSTSSGPSRRLTSPARANKTCVRLFRSRAITVSALNMASTMPKMTARYVHVTAIIAAPVCSLMSSS